MHTGQPEASVDAFAYPDQNVGSSLAERVVVHLVEALDVQAALSGLVCGPSRASADWCRFPKSPDQVDSNRRCLRGEKLASAESPSWPLEYR